MLSSQSGGKVGFKATTNLAIHVTDLRLAEKFYSDVLGFELLDKRQGRLTYSTGALHLYVLEDSQVMPFIPALEVEKYKEARQSTAGG